MHGSRLNWSSYALLCGALLGWSAGAGESLPKEKPAFTRQEKASAALALSGAGNQQLRRRSLQELGAATSVATGSWPAVIGLLQRGDDVSLEAPLVRLIGRCVEVNPEALGAALDGGLSRDGTKVLLCAAASLGREGRAFIPAARRKASGTQGPADVRLTACVALAALGGAEQRDLEAIAEAIGHTGIDAHIVIQAMLLTKPTGWATDSMVESLRTKVQEAPIEWLDAALLLAALGDRGLPALDAITTAKECLRKAIQPGHGRGLLVFYEVSAARLSRTRDFHGSWLKREHVEPLGEAAEDFDRTMSATCSLMVDALFETPEVERLKEMLDDEREAVVVGAIKLCSAVGTPARASSGRLLGVVASNKAESARVLAAYALGSLAGEAELPRMRELADGLSPRYGLLKEVLTQSMHLIRLEAH